MQNYVPFMSGVHYMAHYTNLNVQNFSGFNFMGKIETLFARMYNYFVHNCMWFFEINKLTKLLKCKSKKILKILKPSGSQICCRLP
jgi:hypothetical protein